MPPLSPSVTSTSHRDLLIPIAGVSGHYLPAGGHEDETAVTTESELISPFAAHGFAPIADYALLTGALYELSMVRRSPVSARLRFRSSSAGRPAPNSLERSVSVERAASSHFILPIRSRDK